MSGTRLGIIGASLLFLGLGAWLVRRWRLAGYEGWHTVSTEGR